MRNLVFSQAGPEILFLFPEITAFAVELGDFELQLGHHSHDSVNILRVAFEGHRYPGLP
jgi:hypothetical protein